MTNLDLPPHADTAALLQQLSEHALLWRCLSAVAEYGIADRLAAGPRSAREIADGAGLHEENLYRVLRFLASYGIFREDEGARFHMTPVAEGLRAGVPGSMRERLRPAWQDLIWHSWEFLPHMMRTGEVAFEKAHGQPFFEYRAANAELNTVFNRSLAQIYQVENPLIAANYPFDRHAWVVDVAGGQGGLLAAILGSYPNVHGVLFDHPQVVAAPEALTSEPRLEGRWETAPGDLFKGIPPGGDLYLLKRVLHNWDDDRVLTILEGCRAALRGQARVLIVDALMRPGNEPDPNKFLDVNIMTLTGGRERTESEFRRLCAAAGLTVQEVRSLPAPATLSMIVATLG